MKSYEKYGKKRELNSEKIWKIGRKSKLNSEMIWKIWKISALVIATPNETSSSSLPPPSPLHPPSRHPPPLPPAAAAVAAIHVYPRAAAAAAAIALKFHPKHENDKISDKTKHIMKISHIYVNIYDKTATSHQNSD